MTATALGSLPLEPGGRPAVGDRLWIVEDLRGLAALAVAAFHFRWILPEGVVKDLLFHGKMGVEAFFVISGFVISLALTRASYSLRDYPRFVAKRVVRLDPPYFACVGLVLLLGILSAAVPGYRGEPFSFHTGQVFSHALYLTGFLGMDWLNPVFWTLALEFQFYLLMGLVFPAIGLGKSLGFPLLLLLCLTLPFSVDGVTTVLPYLPYFCLGFVAFRWIVGPDSPVPACAQAILLAVVAGMVHGWPFAAVGLSSALAIVAFRARPGLFGWLGTISYSLYLVHGPVGGRVVNLGLRWGDSPGARWGIFVAAMAASLLAAAAFFRLVERPSREWASRIRYADGNGRGPTGPTQARGASGVATEMVPPAA